MTLRKEVAAMVLAGSIFLPGFQPVLNAACSRSDVEFYLSKGFSHEQITAICSSSPGEVEIQPSAEGEAEVQPSTVPEVEVESEGEEAQQNRTEPSGDSGERDSVPARDNAAFLAAAIEGYDVEVGPESVKYTTKDCFEYGEEDIYGFREKACPEVRFTIHYDGMEIKRSGRRYFYYGPREVLIKGRIERQVLSGLDDLGKYDRKMVLKELERKGKAGLPIRKGIPLEKIEEALMDPHSSRPH